MYQLGYFKTLRNLKQDKSYQGVNLLYMNQAIESIQTNSSTYVQNIIQCINERFNMIENEGLGTLLNNSSIVINNRAWVLSFDSDVRSTLDKQVQAISEIVQRIKIPLINAGGSDQFMSYVNEYMDFVKYADKYMKVLELEPFQLWKSLFKHPKSKTAWRNVSLLIEALLIIPLTNSQVERFFSFMGNVKTDWRSSLGGESLEALLRIMVEGPDLKTWANSRLNDAVDLWYNEKNRRINQSFRGKYNTRSA